MNINDKPLYTLYVVGYPSASVRYYSEVASEMGINLKVMYHGCVIETLYADGYGLEITDADVELLRVEEENEMAVKFYEAELGKGWLKNFYKRASKLMKEKEKDDDLPF
jgi:hypothetical protein